jgi:hypothetical protein
MKEMLEVNGMIQVTSAANEYLQSVLEAEQAEQLRLYLSAG